ncbi:MAG: DUF177 domain-containing protein [Pseudomonadota bacterium]
MPHNPSITEQEWSHFFHIEDMGEKIVSLEISPSEEEAADMARRLDVVSIDNVKAVLNIEKRSGSSTYYVSGQFDAVITQNCVVTLEPIKTNISESFEAWFADKESAVSFMAAKREREGAKNNGEIEILDEADDPEPIFEGIIDLGELVTQHISLAIPPYPHKEGVEYEVTDEEFKLNENSPLKKNPFEALKDWKENR